MNAIAQQLVGRLSGEAYLRFVENRPDHERWQLIDGIAVMMNPPTLVHQRISLNFASALNDALDVHRPDLVALIEGGLRVPGRPDFLPTADILVLDNPVPDGSYASRVYLVGEIRSASNTQEYMSEKLRRYAEHPDNRCSVLIGQRVVRLEMWSRASDWERRVLESPDDSVELPEFGFRCALRDLYRGTPLG
jgi:Uma2 family endonuclease